MKFVIEYERLLNLIAPELLARDRGLEGKGLRTRLHLLPEGLHVEVVEVLNPDAFAHNARPVLAKPIP